MEQEKLAELITKLKISDDEKIALTVQAAKALKEVRNGI